MDAALPTPSAASFEACRVRCHDRGKRLRMRVEYVVRIGRTRIEVNVAAVAQALSTTWSVK
jgi:hypothetical protein